LFNPRIATKVTKHPKCLTMNINNFMPVKFNSHEKHIKTDMHCKSVTRGWQEPTSITGFWNRSGSQWCQVLLKHIWELEGWMMRAGRQTPEVHQH
jgi:hypothetical protein